MKTVNKDTWELIPEEEFASLGIDDMAYVKLKNTIGKNMYSIHTADGSEVAVVEGREVAREGHPESVEGLLVFGLQLGLFGPGETCR